MVLIAVAFIAGILTAFAPCVLPILPIVLGSTVAGRGKYTPYIVIVALAVSIVVSTLCIKTAATFVSISPSTWSLLGGSVIVLVGLSFLFPRVLTIPVFSKLERTGSTLLQKGVGVRTYMGDILAGSALGLVFASCSPTYFFILASVLPMSAVWGTIAVISYTFGLTLTLLCIAFLGKGVIGRVGKSGTVQRVIQKVVGICFIVIGILIVTGLEKKIELHLLEESTFDITELEYPLMRYLP